MTGDKYPYLPGGKKSGKQGDECGFPGPIRSEQGTKLPDTDAECYIIQCELWPVAMAQTFNTDPGVHSMMISTLCVSLPGTDRK